jgi:hypothetical protein
LVMSVVLPDPLQPTIPKTLAQLIFESPIESALKRR